MRARCPSWPHHIPSIAAGLLFFLTSRHCQQVTPVTVVSLSKAGKCHCCNTKQTVLATASLQHVKHFKDYSSSRLCVPLFCGTKFQNLVPQVASSERRAFPAQGGALSAHRGFLKGLPV